jgi:hypothetical protein
VDGGGEAVSGVRAGAVGQRTPVTHAVLPPAVMAMATGPSFFLVGELGRRPGSAVRAEKLVHVMRPGGIG